MWSGAREILTKLRPGGIILFKRNVAGLAELQQLCRDIHAAIDPPPLIAIDEEGGRVTRLSPPLSGLPPAHVTSRLDLPRLEDYWKRYGSLLSTIGFDIDFAPVVDLCPQDAPNGIADRSYGTDPAHVISCASAAARGLRSAGVLPTIKHFPGLGSTLLDSHHHLPSIQKAKDAFEREDLVPFKALLPEAPAVMIGHGHYPFYAGPDPLAATLSKEICSDLLRSALGFTGTAISDDLEMKAVAARVPWEELAPRTIEAGSDMVLICHRADRAVTALEALVKRARADDRFAARCEEAAGRVGVLRSAAGAARAGSPGSTPGAGTADAIESARAALMESASSIRESIA